MIKYFLKIVLATKNLFYKLIPARLREQIKFSMIDFVEKPPILIYQMGKVGSTSIHETLLSMNLNRPIYHAHYLSHQGIKDARSWLKHHLGKVPGSVDYFEMLGKKVHRNLGMANYTVLSGVRDPIAFEISDFFELVDKIDHGCIDRDGNLDIDKVKIYLVDRLQMFDEVAQPLYSTMWFEQELKGTFGIDIYNYPFPHNKGYQVYKFEGINLLIYQFEQLETIFSSAISELFDLDVSTIPELKRSNVGKEKWYSELYADLKKKFIVTPETCVQIYESQYVRHFYSQEMIDEWTSHWSNERTR